MPETMSKETTGQSISFDAIKIGLASPEKIDPRIGKSRSLIMKYLFQTFRRFLFKCTRLVNWC